MCCCGSSQVQIEFIIPVICFGGRRVMEENGTITLCIYKYVYAGSDRELLHRVLLNWTADVSVT